MKFDYKQYNAALYGKTAVQLVKELEKTDAHQWLVQILRRLDIDRHHKFSEALADNSMSYDMLVEITESLSAILQKPDHPMLKSASNVEMPSHLIRESKFIRNLHILQKLDELCHHFDLFASTRHPSLSGLRDFHLAMAAARYPFASMGYKDFFISTRIIEFRNFGSGFEILHSGFRNADLHGAVDGYSAGSIIYKLRELRDVEETFKETAIRDLEHDLVVGGYEEKSPF